MSNSEAQPEAQQTQPAAPAPAAPAVKRRPRKVGVTYDLTTGNYVAFALSDPDAEGKQSRFGEVSGNISDFSGDVRRQLELHGLSQKITDEARNGEDVAERLRMVTERIQTLKDGKWGEKLSDGMVDRILETLRVYAERKGIAVDLDAWRTDLTKSAALRHRVLLEKPQVYAVYQELYGVPEPAEDEVEDLSR